MRPASDRSREPFPVGRPQPLGVVQTGQAGAERQHDGARHGGTGQRAEPDLVEPGRGLEAHDEGPALGRPEQRPPGAASGFHRPPP